MGVIRVPFPHRLKVEESELWSVLWKHPIYEKGITLYSTIMNPSQGRVQMSDFYNSYYSG